MRLFVTPYRYLPVVLACAGVWSASAEVVRLKNGDVIYADQVKQAGNKVQYAVGDDTYTIPKALVQSIDRTVPSPPRATELPTYTPTIHVGGEERLLDQVVHAGAVNRDALSSIESQGNAAETAIAFYIAGRQEFQDGKYGEAHRDFESALRYDPQNPAIVNFYAALLVKTGNAQQAIPYAERAVRLAPDSADALVVLGYGQYAVGRPKDAIQSWKHSLQLRPDGSVQRLVERAGRELAAESNYSERETGHFVLRYEGSQSSEALRAQILSTLESEYTELAQNFGVEPRSAIQVVLYTNQTFFDVTQAPSWIGALNDGKLRIPLQGLDSVTPDLARILKHELTHSFVNQLSMGRCPTWLNEGIAQTMEPRSLGPRGARLAELFRQEHEIPLNMLEGGFSSLSGMEASLAYDESLAAVDYIRATYGMSDVLRILQKLGQGESTESAFRSTVHCDYRQLESDVGTFLLRQFGN